MVYFRYYLKSIGSNEKELEKFFYNQDKTKIGFREMNRLMNLFSGDLDARKIKVITKKLGIPIKTTKGETLLKIKNIRNKLAHGEKSYTTVARNYTIEDIIKMKEDEKAFLESTIKEYEKFLLSLSRKL